MCKLFTNSFASSRKDKTSADNTKNQIQDADKTGEKVAVKIMNRSDFATAEMVESLKMELKLGLRHLYFDLAC